MAALLTAANLRSSRPPTWPTKPCVAQVVRYRYLSPLSQFPGPFWGSVTRLWIAYHNVKGDEPRVFRELHPAPRPRGARDAHHAVRGRRDAPARRLLAPRPQVAALHHRQLRQDREPVQHAGRQDAKTHARFRKIAAAPYSFPNVRRMEPLLDGNIERWMDKLQTRFAGTGKAFDFAPWAVYMAYDIISEVGFGQPFGFTEQERDVEGLIQGFHDGADGVWRHGADSGIGTLMRFRDRLIAERIEANEKGTAGGRIDLLQTFLEARDEDGRPLDLEYVRAEILLVLLAGADTTGTTVNALTTHLMAHPAAYDKVNGRDRRGRQGWQVVGHAAARRGGGALPLLRGVRARDDAAQPGDSRGWRGPGGMELYGKHAPEGTEVTCNQWVVHRDPAVYGDDADEFRPERWLEDEARTREMLKYSMAFGYGPRECLGRHIAMMELFKGPLQFLRHFRVEALDRARPGKYVYKGGIGYFEEVTIKIERRELDVKRLGSLI
ncbi:hypothetical protein RB598_000025 [Gaeumannomyces tritici]